MRMNSDWMTSGLTCAGFGDVSQDRFEPKGSAIDLLEIGFRAGVQLRPDFAPVFVQDAEGSLHVRAMKHAGIGDQHQRDIQQMRGLLRGRVSERRCGLDDLIEVSVCGRLAITRKSNVGQPAHGHWGGTEFVGREQASGCDELKGLLQFFQHARCVNETSLALRNTIHLAVNTIEIADFVGVQIDPDRYSFRPPTQHGIYEPIRFEVSFVLSEELFGGHEWTPSFEIHMRQTTSLASIQVIKLRRRRPTSSIC